MKIYLISIMMLLTLLLAGSVQAKPNIEDVGGIQCKRCGDEGVSCVNKEYHGQESRAWWWYMNGGD
jgi:hypothetical protein